MTTANEFNALSALSDATRRSKFHGDFDAYGLGAEISGRQMLASYLSPAEGHRWRWADGTTCEARRSPAPTSPLPVGARAYVYVFTNPVHGWVAEFKAVWYEGSLLRPQKLCRLKVLAPYAEAARRDFAAWMRELRRPEERAP